MAEVHTRAGDIFTEVRLSWCWWKMVAIVFVVVAIIMVVVWR